MPSPFAGSAVPAEAAHSPNEAKPPSDDSKKGHRRGRSLSSMLNPLKMKGRRSSTADELDVRNSCANPKFGCFAHVMS